MHVRMTHQSGEMPVMKDDHGDFYVTIASFLQDHISYDCNLHISVHKSLIPYMRLSYKVSGARHQVKTTIPNPILNKVFWDTYQKEIELFAEQSPLLLLTPDHMQRQYSMLQTSFHVMSLR